MIEARVGARGRGLLCVVVTMCLTLSVGPTRAAPGAGVDRPARPDELHSGGLLLRPAEPGAAYVRAPTLHTDVAMDIRGPFARVTVRQTFRNDGETFVEGLYVFPLPEKGAVDRLRMQIGERFIEGVVRERGEARREYEQARREGRQASLLEQERPNIFTTSVTNIGPGDSVTVEIEYQETLVYDAGAFSIRFPLVVGPRYIPVHREVVEIGQGGWVTPVADSDRITPPVVHPDAGPINPVTLAVTLDTGFPIEDLESVTHAIDATDLPDGRIAVSLADTAVPADRDFQLSWRPSPGTAPGAGLFTETRNGETYGLLMFMPPSVDSGDAVAPPAREVIFVIDTSGSMEGESIRQARIALAIALDRLRPEDRFNIIQFNSASSALFPRAVPATPNAITRARRHVARLAAEGGTEMLPAMRMALARSATNGLFRQVVFLTDGAIGNEAQLFETIAAMLGDSRLFTIGIGSAPNSHFMTKAAEFGRGTFTYIDAVDAVQERMTDLLAKLERPALTDIEIQWPVGVSPEAYPVRVPDLYHGEPVVVALRGLPAAGTATITGGAGAEAWRSDLTFGTGAGGAAGTSVVWARRKIAALMDGAYRGVALDKIRAAVIETALAHHLTSRYTSLVAVDVTPVRAPDQPIETVELPTNLPHGWDFEAVFGAAARAARDAAPPPPPNAPMQDASLTAMPQVAAVSTPLPQTATPATLRILIGLMVLLIAATLFAWARRRPMVVR